MSLDRESSARRLRAVAAGESPFGALGSVGGFAVGRRVGLDPLGVVTGIGTERDYSYAGGPLKAGSFRQGKLWNAHWGMGAQRALERLREEARLVGADVVVGVTMRVDRVAVGGEPSHVMSFILRGAAMRDSAHRAGADPILCNLSAEEYALLAQGGYRPVGLCIVAAKYGANMKVSSARITTQNSHRVLRRLVRRPLAPRALPDVADTVSGVRHAAVDDLARQARALHGEGIVNAVVDLEIPDPEISTFATRYSLTVTAIATAISHTRRSEFAPELILRVGGQPPSPPATEESRPSARAVRRRRWRRRSEAVG